METEVSKKFYVFLVGLARSIGIKDVPLTSTKILDFMDGCPIDVFKVYFHEFRGRLSGEGVSQKSVSDVAQLVSDRIPKKFERVVTEPVVTKEPVVTEEPEVPIEGEIPPPVEPVPDVWVLSEEQISTKDSLVEDLSVFVSSLAKNPDHQKRIGQYWDILKLVDDGV